MPRAHTFRPRRLIALVVALTVVAAVAVDASAVAATQARPASSSLRAPNKFKPRKGDYIINFSGSGAGSFSYSWPGFNNPSNSICYNAQSYSMSYTYHWHWEDIVAGVGEGDVYAKWTGGGQTSSATTYSDPCPEETLPPNGTCSGTYISPNGNDLGLWPQEILGGASHKRIVAGYENGGLATSPGLVAGNCGYVKADEYDANDDGFPETGDITAKAFFSLATAKKGKTLSASISRTSHASCASYSACDGDLEQTDTQLAGQASSLTPGSGCSTGLPFAGGSPSENPEVTCTAHDHYTGKLTIQYVKK